MILLVGGLGYIGSAIFDALSPTRIVHCVDLEWRGNPGIPNSKYDYGFLAPHFYSQYSDIILLAGHSSVPAATADPSGAFANNVVAFHRLLNILTDKQRLIYASSSSVYSGFGAFAASENMPQSGNLYDFTKFADDALAHLSGKRCYGLRFGTVNGAASLNMRWELMLNKMVRSAIDDGCVNIANPKVHRPILGINDLVRAVTAILDGDGEPGIYNLASFNATVAALGATVADELNVPLVLGEPTPTYDFEIQSTKFQEAYPSFRFQETAVSIVRNLVEALNGSNAERRDSLYSDYSLSGV